MDTDKIANELLRIAKEVTAMAMKRGYKIGDWVVAQYTPVVYGDLGDSSGGYAKVVNQKTYDEFEVQHDHALRSPKWWTSTGRVQIIDKNLIRVIRRAIEVLVVGYAMMAVDNYLPGIRSSVSKSRDFDKYYMSMSLNSYDPRNMGLASREEFFGFWFSATATKKRFTIYLMDMRLETDDYNKAHNYLYKILTHLKKYLGGIDPNLADQLQGRDSDLSDFIEFVDFKNAETDEMSMDKGGYYTYVELPVRLKTTSKISPKTAEKWIVQNWSKLYRGLPAGSIKSNTRGVTTMSFSQSGDKGEIYIEQTV